jgi:glutathione synthase/RimK-type ligase-like ATP-grasp enzyme
MMDKYKSASVKSKWAKTKWMIRDQNLKQYIPETGIYRKASLKRFAKKYKLIYFKPDFGTGGFHIARIERIKMNKFLVKSNSGKSVAQSVDSLHQCLNKMAKGKSYLLQRGIDLKHSGGHPFDLRVMIQKSRGWVASAYFSKLGKRGKVATNYHQGGKLGYLEQTLRGAGYSKKDIAKTRKQLLKMGIHTGKCFDRHHKGFRELGLDVAIDRKNRFWILEVNTRPQFYPLKYMKNKTMYRTILKYGKEYGRKK